MFTGIVEELGSVTGILRRKNLSVLTIKAKKVLKSLKQGDSIAVNGVCLTMVRKKSGAFECDVMRETLMRTTIGSLHTGGAVNLERSLKLGSRVSGHFVSGHVDHVAVIKNIARGANYTELTLSMNKTIAPFIVPKGSICIDGVSLTVGKVGKDSFSVHLIPFTKQVTTLGLKKSGDKVNVETDIMARYLYKLKNG